MLTLGLSLLLTTGVTSYFLLDSMEEEEGFVGPPIPEVLQQPVFNLKYWWHGYKITNPKEALIISGITGYIVYKRINKTLKKL